MTSWPDTVPLYADGGATDFATMNQPIQALVDRTDYLKTVYEQIASNKRLVSTCDKLAADSIVGDAVYYDLDTLLFEKGLAKWSAVYAADGSLIPAASSLVLGFVLSKDTATSGQICLYGEVDDAAFMTAVFGGTVVPGLYWLSPTEPGKVTMTEPPCKAPCIFATADGRCYILESKAWLPNHIHKTFMLAEGWLGIADPAFDDMEKPVGALYGYNIASDYNLSSLFSIFPGAVKVSADGEILYSDNVVVNSDNIWWLGAGDPNGYTDMECYALIPFSYGEPIVRGAKTDYPEELLISALQGMLTINPVPWADQGVDQKASAVQRVEGRKFWKTPVVSQLTAGPGATVNYNLTTGAAVVSLESQIEALFDARLVDLSNAVEVADAPYIYFSLPKSRSSYIVGVREVPKIGVSSSFKMGAWMIARGIQGGTIGSPITFPALTVTLTFVPTSKSAAVDLATATVVTTAFAAFPSVQDNLYYKEIPVGDRITVTSEGTIYLKIDGANDAYDKDLFRFGTILYVSA